MDAVLSPDQWRAVLMPQDRWNRRHLLALFAAFGIPDSFLDVGCGTGVMVSLAHKMGIVAQGIDQLNNDGPFWVMDLEQGFSLERRFDLVTCLEVMEHLAPAVSLRVIRDLVSHVSPGGMLVFSAALPGQGGDGHVNLRAPWEWRNWIHEEGLTYRADLTRRLALVWANIESPLMWLAANVQVFTGKAWRD